MIYNNLNQSLNKETKNNNDIKEVTDTTNNNILPINYKKTVSPIKFGNEIIGSDIYEKMYMYINNSSKVNKSL